MADSLNTALPVRREDEGEVAPTQQDDDEEEGEEEEGEEDEYDEDEEERAPPWQAVLAPNPMRIALPCP